MCYPCSNCGSCGKPKIEITLSCIICGKEMIEGLSACPDCGTAYCLPPGTHKKSSSTVVGE